MQADDTAEMLEVLRHASKCFELAREYRFVGYREHPRLGPREVTITVRDSGEVDHGLRWSVHAVDEDGRAAAGNSGANLEAVIATVHWGDLDREPI